MATSRTLYEPSTEHDACGFGFVADIAGRPSHQIVRDALTVLVNLEHRGASGSERNTGDGAGILVALPYGFLGAAAAEAGLALPDRGYGVAMVFLPRDAASREACRQKFEATLASEGLGLLGWRDVPTDPTGLGDSARGSQPVIAQAFIARPDGLGLTPEDDDLAFERRLYVARRLIEKAVTRSALPGRGEFYIPSMSCRTIVYKGMLNASQLLTFYPDLLDPRFESAIGLVHSRFSTNTFPSWSRAHPYRYISHNGEINTLRGNVNWMFARQSTFRSSVFGDDLQKILPAIDVDGSDTTIFDNVLELLHLSGRSLAHVMLMMVPEPWGRDTGMDPQRRAFYEYHSCLMEPWDGPASLAFTDGTRVGATLDRNGLRPGRYYVTKDGRVVMASEAGVLDIPPADVVEKGRLQPGRMFLVDTAQGRIIPDDELKAAITSAQPYEQWVRESLVNLEDLPAPGSVIPPDHETVLRRQEVFGYTAEDVRLIITPMATTGADPIGSMGNDAPLAVLSERPQLLYNYFKQLFAQVTNPPVDAIREEIIMATDRSIGPEANLLEPGPDAAHQVALPSPVISNAELEQIRALDGGPASHGFRTITLPILFKVSDNGLGLRRAIEDLRQRASEAIDEGYNQVILSDRGHNETDAPIPALLAVSAVHHHLVRAGTRGRVGLLLESGEPREAHHFCLLIGYGASAINPYLAFETIDDQVRLGAIPGPTEEAEHRYRKAATKGVIKAISRMGISTVHSYHGAQVFEAIGLNRDFVDEYFTWTPTRIGGIGIELVSKEVKARQDRAWPPHRPIVHTQLPPGGQYQYRADGENHLFNPLTIHTLQRAVRTGDYARFKDYSALVDDQSTRLATLRGLLELKPALRPVPIEEVEPVEEIVKRFKTGAMSYGSISQEAHESARDRDEPPGRQVEHGRGRRGPRALRARGERRLEELRDQAGRVGPLRRDERVPRQRPRAPDQDGPGREARRGRPAAGLQGLPVDREDPALDAGRGAHQPAAAPRHLLDRGPRGAHLRPQEREPPRADQREARRRGGRRDGGGGRRQGARGRGAHLRPRRRDGRVAADLDQARGHPVGAGPRRGAPGPADERPAQPDHRRGGRPAQDRPRRRGRRAARRGGVRVRDRAAGGARLRHDAGLPPQHLPGGRRDPGPGAAQAVRGRPGARRQLHALRRAGGARAHGPPGLPDDRRDGRPLGPPRDAPGARPLEGARPRLQPDPRPARGARDVRAAPADRPGARRGGVAGRDGPAGAVRAGPHRGAPGPRRAADPQRQPGRRDDARLRGHAPLGPRRAARGHDQPPLHGLGGPELRRVHPQGHHADARGRHQRLRRQGAVRRAAHRAPVRRTPRSAPTRTSSPATSRCTGRRPARRSSAASRASGSGSATPAPWRWSRAWATTAAST